MDKFKDRLVTWSILITLMIVSILPGFAQTASIDITGNLVNNTQTATISSSTWQGGTFVSALTCWAPGDPGYCGPNPMIRPDGNINFSYGLGNLYQYANVAKSLPYSGTNLVTTGFLFSWSSKNGNGWDDGRLDQLSAYVNLYDKGGSTILESYNYNLNFIHNWTIYNWSQDWSKLRRPNEVSNVQFGFVGMDNNYWAGPYGPEITNVSFQLKYKPDPCVNNPLYSPDCPKFQETLQKNLATITPVDTLTLADSTTTNTTVYQEQAKAKPLDKQDLFEKEPGVTEPEIKQDPKMAEVNIDRLIDTLIKIDDNQQREQRISLEASTNAVQETDKLTQQVIKQAEQIASRSARLSIESSVSMQQQVTISNNKETKTQQSLSLFQAPTSSNSGILQLPGSQQQFSILQIPNQQSNNTATATTQDNKTRQQANVAPNLLAQSTTQETIVTSGIVGVGITINQSTNNSINTSFQLSSINPLLGQTQDILTQQSNFLTNKADPINSVLEAKPISAETKQETKVAVVKQDVQDSELAGNLSISNIAKLPIGFNSYLIALADVGFYAPKEIYRNQRTIDNRRALQNLRSDQLHQQMINQQWR